VLGWLKANQSGQSANGVRRAGTKEQDDFGGASANALICPSGGGGCAFKAVATSAGGKLTSTPKQARRFTTAKPAATKCGKAKAGYAPPQNAGDCEIKTLPAVRLAGRLYSLETKRNPSSKSLNWYSDWRETIFPPVWKN
jgi:hypothetical protein